VFHVHETTGNQIRMAPSAYYVDAEYEPVAVRLYTETTGARDIKVDIFDDGVSIFADNAVSTFSAATGYSSGTSATEIILPAGENSEELAEDFSGEPIEEGSWLHCNLVDAGGGKNITVQLELHQVSEDDESED